MVRGEDTAFRNKYGSRYRVMRDEAGDPFIPCWGRGAQFEPGELRPHVYQWSLDGKILGYVGAGNRKLGALLKKHPGVFFACWQGDGEFETKFMADRLAEVARSLGCQRRRSVDEKTRRRLVEAGMSSRFEKRTAQEEVLAAQDRI